MVHGQRWLSAIGIALTVSACQAVQGSGPPMNNASSLSNKDLPFDVIDLTPNSVAAFRVDTRPTAGPSRAPEAPTDAGYGIGPADVLSVHIIERYVGGVFATLQQPNTLVVTRRVRPDGTIDVPFVGAVSVVGRTLPQIEAEILSKLAGKANDPQVMVALEEDKTNTVTVSGAVAKPGPLSLLGGIRSVAEAIEQAGGPLYPTGPAPPPDPTLSPGTEALVVHRPGSDPPGAPAASNSTGGQSSQVGVLAPTAKKLSDASQMRVVVRRAGHVILDRPFSEVLLGHDASLQRGDTIVVRPDPQVVTILGAVTKAGNLPLVKPTTSLAEALAEASGLFDSRANTTGVFVFRAADSPHNAGSRGRIFRLDLLQPTSIFVAQQFAVYPHDVLYVTNAPLYEYEKVLTYLYRTFAIVNAARTQ